MGPFQGRRLSFADLSSIFATTVISYTYSAWSSLSRCCNLLLSQNTGSISFDGAQPFVPSGRAFCLGDRADCHCPLLRSPRSLPLRQSPLHPARLPLRSRRCHLAVPFA